MGIFSRKPAYCTICNKQITAHKNKAKREWGIKSPLCSDCYLDKMQESYDATRIKKCVSCGVTQKSLTCGSLEYNGIWKVCFAKNALTIRS